LHGKLTSEASDLRSLRSSGWLRCRCSCHTIIGLRLILLLLSSCSSIFLFLTLLLLIIKLLLLLFANSCLALGLGQTLILLLELRLLLLHLELLVSTFPSFDSPFSGLLSLLLNAFSFDSGICFSSHSFNCCELLLSLTLCGLLSLLLYSNSSLFTLMLFLNLLLLLLFEDFLQIPNSAAMLLSELLKLGALLLFLLLLARLFGFLILAE